MCRVDNDVYFCAATKEDGTEYYKYVLVYTDDMLVLSGAPMAILDRLAEFYRLKDGSVGPPTKYLGSDVGKFRFPEDGETGKEYWSLGSNQYVKDQIRNVEAWLDKRGRSLKSKVSSVFPAKYKPELDVTPHLDEEDTGYYHSTIGILRWAVELGRMDITCEVSQLAAFLSLIHI